MKPLFSIALGSLLVVPFAPVLAQSSPERPNIIIILADDAGYADFGCYGGVGRTPQIDRLASEGMRFTRAFSNARCMPSRLALLTGLPPQLADFNLFNEIKGNSVTLAEILREAGYSTYMVGKWHLGTGSATILPRPIPSERGFDRFYGIWDGAAQPRKSSLLDPARGNGTVRIIQDGDPLPWEQVPEDYYVTDTWTDKAIEMIASTPANRPFFLYLAHTAPHWPLDPFPENIAAYNGAFNAGWDALREQILQNQKNLGIFPSSQTLSPRFDFVKDWSSATTSERNKYTSGSAQYYASLTEMDTSIGRLRTALEASGRAQNTLIIFISDNGADDLVGGNARGMVSNTPFSGFKLTYFEGGVATPLVAWWPGRIPPNTINTTHEVHFVDFMPTVLDLTGAAYPQTYNGNKIFPHHGRSFLPALLNPGYDGGPRHWFWEHDAQRGVWNAPWKAIFVDYRHPAISDDPNSASDSAYFTPDRDGWHLYNLTGDRSESVNLATAEPERLAAMIQGWRDWATSVGWTPNGRWAADNPLDEGFRGASKRATPETYQRLLPFSGDQSRQDLIQVFGFDAPVRGLRRLGFEAVNPTGGPMAVTVYGANAMPTIPEDAAANPATMPDQTTIPSLGTPLATFDFGGQLFDWSDFATAVEFGNAQGFTHVTLIFQLPDSGQAVSKTRLLTASYNDWAAYHFAPSALANPAVSGPDAKSPAGDTTNFLKYLANLAPDAVGGLTPTIKLADTNLTLELDLLPGALERNELLWEKSSDLTQWTPIAPRWLGATSSSAVTRERLAARFAAPVGPRTFIRATPVSNDGEGSLGGLGNQLHVVDSTFDAGFLPGATWAFGASQADAGWVSNASGSRWNHSGTDAFADNSGSNNLVQILTDNNRTRGTVTLRFDATNSAGRLLAVYLYGSNELFNLNLSDTNGPRIGSTNIPHTILINGQNFNAVTATSTTYSVTFNVPPGGFKYYGLMFRTNGVVGTENQRIDNVQFE